MSTEKLTIVSGDSHATLLPEHWDEYVERDYHYLLPQFHKDNEAYTQLMGMFAQFTPEVLEVIDADGVWAGGGVAGAWDLDLRLAQMDRDGIAAEMVYPGDSRAIMPLTPIYRRYPLDVVAAGNRAYHRWLSDTMGPAGERLLLVGDPTQAVGMDGVLAELKWMAEHGFVGTSLPNPFGREQPSLFHEYWDPYWAACADYGLTVVVHAGYGGEQAEFMNKLNGIKEKMLAAGETDLINAIINNAEGFFSLDLRPRRAMWQMMLGGAFDRHPNFRLMLAEIRADWLPALLGHLDASFEAHRDELPAERRPSEYWHERCLTSLSFVHKAEVDMRHEIGIETVTFGRDYPHTEGTWPNTRDWMSDAFAGVPEDELRLMMGENAIRVLGLDGDRIRAVAEKVGPTVEEVTGRDLDLDERLVANWDTRAGYLKPAEAPNPEAVDALLDVDLAALAGAR